MKPSEDRELVGSGNLITRDIRNLFPVLDKLPSPKDLIEKVQIDQYLEKMEDVYRLNLVSEQSAVEDVSHILRLDDPNLRGIAWSCLGGIHTFNGNYRKAFAAFNMALDQPVTGDVKSYMLTELSNLLRKLAYMREAISVLESASRVTTSEKLIWRIRTYTGLCHKYVDPEYSLRLLKDSVRHYRETQDAVRLANVLRHVGNILVHLEDFQAAAESYDEAMTLSVEQGLPKFQNDILNDKGWMFIQKGEFDRARSLFTKQLKKQLSPYLMSLALQNLGYVEYTCGNYGKAITYHSQSLRLTTQYEMRDMAFEDYYKLGLCYDRLREGALADHFFSLGFAELQKEIDLGLRIMGFRKKLLNSYVEFLRKNQKVSGVDPKDEIFGFAVDKPLREIRNIFHKGLLNLHLERTKNAPELCSMLGINTRTYFLYQKRLGLKRGRVQKGPHENPYLKQYLESLLALSWRDANRQFDADLYAYLLSKYRHNKKKMAQVLKVSYQQVLQKTR